MSQRTATIEDQEIVVMLELKVTLKSFSNHDGYTENQVDEAIDEFRTSVRKELEKKVVNEYQMEEFLYGVDFVDYEVESNDV